MTKKEIIKRVRDFLYNLSCIELDFSGEPEPDENFGDYKLPYFIYMDDEQCGCFENVYKFMTIDEVNNLVKQQLSNDFDHWQNIVIFDVKKNKVIDPHI